LQRFFQQGSKVAAAGQFDYATEMYTQCVVGDPGNPLYVRSFLANLHKKYNNNKKGEALAGMKTAGTKASVKKAAMSKNWVAVITTGLAHDADPTEPNINRLYGRALGKCGKFDEAIACWERVRKAKPTDEEAPRAISNLQVERTIRKGGYETAESSRDVRANKFVDDDDDSRLNPEQRLLRAIEKDPTKTVNYIELYQRDEQFEKAEVMLTKALEVSGGDVSIRERLEDVQLRRARQAVEIAEKKARDEKTEAATTLYSKLKADLNSKEIQVYASRCERYPTNTGFKYELAVRLKRAGKYSEAVKLFQDCRSDLKRKGLVYMSLGECFAQMKQYKLALDNFEKASVEIPEKDLDQRKQAMYNAGKLAIHLRDVEKADKLLSDLANLDFSFKDVSQLLDKLTELREDGGSSLDE
jgi:tetratricopeptide (TPR) repeat protein